MALITLGDLKSTGIASRLNLCATNARFADYVNRVIEWLLLHGAWAGTEQIVQLAVNSGCIVLPNLVANLQAVRACGHAQFVQNGWYEFLPLFDPLACTCTWHTTFTPYGTVPIPVDFPGVIVPRTFVSDASDVGKAITFFGTDVNGVWVRTQPAPGVWQDGETVTLALPFADTGTQWSAITGIQKDPTNEALQVFYYAAGDSTTTLSPLATYAYWETRPNYRRYKVHNWEQLCAPGGGGCGVTSTGCQPAFIEARVKLDFQPAAKDNDFLRISNRPALELAMEALKAKDDGDYARCDALMYGNARNLRVGAIPLLQQELRTLNGDQFTGNVATQGTASLRKHFAGFI